MPICAYVGVTTKISDDKPISHSVSATAGLRPTRSAYMPISRPPSGRIRKPTPNVAKDISNWPVGLPTGKYSRPISVAKKL